MKNKEPIDELMTPERLAEELRVSEQWIRDHMSGRRKPLLPHIWLGERRGLLRFRRSQIKTFLQLNTRNEVERGIVWFPPSSLPRSLDCDHADSLAM